MRCAPLPLPDPPRVPSTHLTMTHSFAVLTDEAMPCAQAAPWPQWPQWPQQRLQRQQRLRMQRGQGDGGSASGHGLHGWPRGGLVGGATTPTRVLVARVVAGDGAGAQ